MVVTFGAVDAEIVRPTGTFAYITEFAVLAEISAIISLFLLLTSDGEMIGRLRNAEVLIIAHGAMLASGSRGPV